jgi:2-polyprenyl-3-methyl-5-hydroxy-6-metoxy-1,4-benzoquinol methylase
MSREPAFDYEAKRWGSSRIEPRPSYVQGLKLRLLLDALRDVQGDVVDVGCGAGNVARAIAESRPDLPAEFCAIVHKMMAKQPADRYQTCR